MKKPSRGAMVASGVGLVAATSLLVAQKRRHASRQESPQPASPLPEAEMRPEGAEESAFGALERMEPPPEE
jgi:hypothetical protein